MADKPTEPAQSRRFRLPSWFTWKRVALVAVILFVVLFGFSGIRSRVVIQPFTTADSLDKEGTPATGLTRAFTVALTAIVEEADTRLREADFSPPQSVPDIEVPVVGLSFRQAVDYLAHVFGRTPFRIELHHVSGDADRCTLLLSVSGSRLAQPVWRALTCDSENIELGLRAAARAALRVITPVTLAVYCRDHITECEPVDALNYAVRHPPEDDDVWAYNLWGAILTRRGDAEGGEVMLREALRLDPGFGLARFNLAYTLDRLGRAGPAEVEYRRAINDRDRFVRSLAATNLGLLQLRQNQTADAENSFRRAIASDPLRYEAFSALGNALSKQTKYEDAIQMYARSYVLAPHEVLALLNWGRALEQLNRPEEALRRYQLAAAAGPTSPLPVYALGLWHGSYGQPADSLAFLRRFLEMTAPGDPLRPDAESRIDTIQSDVQQAVNE